MNGKLIIVFFFIAALITSCENQPHCSDENVRQNLISLIEEEYSKEVENIYFYENYNYNDIKEYASDNNLNIDKLDKETELKVRKNAFEFALDQLSKSRIELNGIRILDIQEHLKKCSCASELIINENKTDIEYTAQYTEDGQIYIEYYNVK